LAGYYKLNLVETNNTILTLSQKKPYVVMEIIEDGFMVATNSALVKKLWIEEAWRLLTLQ